MGQFDFLDDAAPTQTARRPSPRRAGSRVVTIQKTSKNLKAGQLMAWATLFVSIAVFAAMLPASGQKANPAAVVPALGIVVGFFWIIVNRWSRWWHHG